MSEGYKIKEGDEVIDHTRDSKIAILKMGARGFVFKGYIESDKKSS